MLHHVLRLSSLRTCIGHVHTPTHLESAEKILKPHYYELNVRYIITTNTGLANSPLSLPLLAFLQFA